MPELQQRRDQFLALLPTDLVVVCDAKGMLNNRDLLLRMNEAMNTVSKVRSSVRSSPTGDSGSSSKG